jgi:succinate-acetate transporter protein
MTSTTDVAQTGPGAQTPRTPPETASDPTRGIADPGPLGLAAFALTTFVLSLFNAKIAPENLETLVLPLALFYGGIAQFVAGLWEFRKNNTFGATAFVSYGAFWLAFAAYVQFAEPALKADGATPEDVKLATGLFLIGWAIFTLYMFIASLRTNAGLIGVFLTLFLTFACLAIGDLTGVSAIATIGGVIGIVSALIAWYTSAAIVTNSTWGRSVLPVGARS